jgi:PAS domain S-box-containing protein
MTILIVDDNEMNLYQLQVLLGANGYQVFTAVNGAEALATAQQNPPDLIISDILMPVMDGFALCHAWKKDERLRQIPFVFYTATYTDERDREFALSLGAEQFLVKPEEPDVFIRKIREVIQQVQRLPAPPAPPAAITPAHLPVEAPPQEESGYLKQYNEALIRKLEAKMQQLEQTNRELERDITERKRAEEELRESRRRLQVLMGNLPGMAYRCLNTPEWLMKFVSEGCLALTGYTPEEITNRGGLEYGDLIHPEDREAVSREVQEGVLAGRPFQLEYRITTKDGRLVHVWEQGRLVAGPEHEERWLEGFITDITQRKQAEQELRRVNRALRTTSECNQALVRAVEESDLLNQICESLVREGGYRMAWVGFAEHDEGKSVRPVAHAGFEGGYLQAASITWADTERGRGPTGTAIRTKKPVVARSIQTDASLAPWREEQLKQGYASTIALPILVKGQVLGTLTIYAKDVDAFDSEETQLLTELSNDLAYGIQALRTRAEHKRAEEEISHLASFPMLNPQPVIEVDLDGRVCYRNQAARQFLPDSFQLATSHPFLANWSAVVDACRRGDDPPTRTVPIGDRWYEQVIHYVRYTQRVRIYSFDVTERKRAEDALIEERHLLHTLMDNLPDNIYFKDRESRFTQINLALAKELKLSHPAQAVGKTDFDILPGEQSKEFYRDEQEIIRTGHPLVDKEEKLIWPGGNTTWLSTTKMPLRDPNGNIIGTFGVSRDVSERKRAEEELLFKTALLEAESETTIDGILVVDRLGQVLLANKNFARMWNIPDETIRAKEDKKVIEKGLGQLKDPEAFLERVNHLYVHEMEKSQDEVVFKDGRVLERYSSPLQDSTGKLYGRIWYFRDITKRKQAEAELQASETRYRRLFETAQDGILILDAESGEIKDVNPFLTDLMGFTQSELLGMKPWDIGPLRHVFLSEISFEELQTKGYIRYEDLPLETRDGRKIAVEFVSNVYLADHQRVIQCNIRDITERKRAEAEHVRLVTAIEQSAEAVVITNIQGEIEYVNPAFTHITGYSREEVLGQNPRILKSGKHDVEFYRRLWATILSGQIWHGELINRRKDGKLYTEEMIVTPVRDAGSNVTHFTATKQDVTERKTLEAQLHQASKMEAVGRLAGGVAHDFNNLLTVINGYSELLQERLASDAKSSTFVNEIYDAGQRAASLTRQLLAFSRRQVLAPQVLSLNAVVSNLEKMLKRLIGEDIKLNTLLDPSLHHAKADPGQIEQVIMNLAVNARDAMPTGGLLTIETRNVELDEGYASSHPSVTPGPHVMLAVGDTGVGMTRETMARIFEPFFTTKEIGKGTGLGLATVYGIVKQSGGSIWVYSEPDQGTVFKVYFPVISESPAAEQAEAGTDSSSGSETILVVEDEEAVRSLVRIALVSGGYQVLETPDAEGALVTCAHHAGPIHLLLTDVVMPQMSGPVVASKVAALRPGIRVLYMSGYTDDAVVRHGVLTQEMPFIQKPFSPAALRKKIREVLGGK